MGHACPCHAVRTHCAQSPAGHCPRAGRRRGLAWRMRPPPGALRTMGRGELRRTHVPDEASIGRHE